MMKKNVFEYKGYHTTIEFDAETLTLHGKIEGINDFINFESKDPITIEQEFHNAVDDYLDFCAEVGKEPDKEYKGTFNVRIDPALHKMIALLAHKNGDSLNGTVEKAIQAYVMGNSESNTQLQHTIKILSDFLVTEGIYKKDNPLQISKGSNIVSFTNSNNIKMVYEEKRTN